MKRVPAGAPVDKALAIHRHNLGALMIADPAKIDELAVYLQSTNAPRGRVRSRRFSRADTLVRALPLVTARLDGIWGGRDATAYPHLDERADTLRSFQPAARFEVIAGAGHWVQYEAADRFNPLLAEIVAQRRSEVAMTTDNSTSLAGKVAVMTGGSSGIGAASARVARGRRGTGRCRLQQGRRARHAVVAELPGDGHKAMYLPLEDTAQIRKVAAAVREEFGRADVLVNSAGFTRMVPHHDLEALDDDLIDAVLTANVAGRSRRSAPLRRCCGNRATASSSTSPRVQRSAAPAARSSTAPRRPRSTR